MKDQDPIDYDRLAGVLHNVLTYDKPDRPALIARIPVICNDIRDLTEDVSAIKDNLKWGVRLILGAVIVAILSTVLK